LFNGNAGGLDIRTASNYIVLSDGDGNPREIINSRGQVLINTTSTLDGNLAILNISGGTGEYGLATSINATSSATQIAFKNPNGFVGSITTSGSATAYNTSSDYRLKNTILPMTGALAKVAALKPVIYKWNIDNSDGEGFIAHELAEVCPQAVHGEKDAVDEDGKPKYQGIDTSFLVATLVSAIQELKAEVDALKSQLNQGA